MFTDLVGSTQLKQRMGDWLGVRRIQEHHAMVRGLLAECRCKKLSVISSPTAPSQPLRGRWSNGERSEPSATDPAGVGNRKLVVVGGPRGACVGVFDKKHPSQAHPWPTQKTLTS
jgi:hypothetical protein